MIYSTTRKILEELSPFISEDGLEATEELHEKEDGSGTETGDKIFLDKKNNVWFEVFENEIVLFYFTDHEHFDDYMTPPADGEPNYIERATDFLKRLLSLRLKKTDTVKGSDMLRVEYAFIDGDGNEEFLGGTWKMINDGDSRPQVEVSVWKFDGNKNRFEKQG